MNKEKCRVTKVFELKVCIFWHLFTFPVARFCLILKCLAAKEMTLPSPGFEPGTFSMWSQCATILPWPLLSNLAKSWEVIPIFVYIAGSQKLLEIKYPFFCFKYFNVPNKETFSDVCKMFLMFASTKHTSVWPEEMHLFEFTSINAIVTMGFYSAKNIAVVLQ